MFQEFIKSSSGLAPMRQGLGLGSIISILSGVVALFGVKGAEASFCQSSSWCETCIFEAIVKW